MLADSERWGINLTEVFLILYVLCVENRLRLYSTMGGSVARGVDRTEAIAMEPAFSIFL